METVTKNNSFYRQIFKLVLPIVVQNLLSAAVSSADVIKIGRASCRERVLRLV